MISKNQGMLYKQEGGQMKKILFIIPLVILLFFTLSCQQAEEPVEEPVIDIEAEKQAVEKATYDFFNAAFAHDYQGIRDLCTEDFLLFESGQVMNVEEFSRMDKLKKQSCDVNGRTGDELRLAGKRCSQKARWRMEAGILSFYNG
jgi:hypothetical protein